MLAVQAILAAIVFWFPKEGIPLWGEKAIIFSKPNDFYKEKTKELEIIKEVAKSYSLKELEEDTLLASSLIPQF